jgi:translation initiation factor 3 subunit A
MDPNSLEVVIMHMMDITESEATAARVKADKVALAAAAKVSDLDQEESPESIMLSSMTEEGAKDRTDREVVVPWLRFLWETYRAVLELLHKLPKLEKVYHKICEKAFKFCLYYSRTLEFRRLCDMLRSHLKNMQSSTIRGQKIPWEWTSDIVELHLQTRFNQLEVATSLELWNEGFRTVEDIHAITVAGRKTPKPKLMAVFYEKLTRIFWVAGNHLFHAFAWFRYYTLTIEFRKDLKSEDKSLLASSVLLAAISIPELKEVVSDTSSAILDDELVSERNQQMANLLDFQTHPSRTALLADIVSRGLLADVFPELTELHNLLDLKFHPLTMVQSLSSTLSFIDSHPTLNMYSLPLQKAVVLRVVQQLSKVYSVVKITFLNKLLVGLKDIDSVSAEKVIIEGVLHRELQLVFDHTAGCIRFSASSASNLIETQVAQLSIDLNKVGRIISSQDQVASSEALATRKLLLEKVAEEAEQSHAALLNRRNLIEQRKIEIERAQEEREKIMQAIMEKEEARRQAEENARLELERSRREEEKRRKAIEKEDIKRIQLELTRLGVFKDESQLAAMDSAARTALVIEAKQELMKAKEEETRKVTEHARRLDHITRAIRIEAGEVVRRRAEEQNEQDQKAYEEEVARLIESSKIKHAASVEEKRRLSRMQIARAAFEAILLADQRAAYDAFVRAQRAKAQNEHRERKVATARRRMYEELERQREEEELERERCEREQHEALRRKQHEEEAAERAREAEEDHIRSERIKEIEAKRLKTLEDKKRALQQQQQSQTQTLSPGNEDIPPLVTSKEKEILWRTPSSVINAKNQTLSDNNSTAFSSPGGATKSGGDWRTTSSSTNTSSVSPATAWQPSAATQQNLPTSAGKLEKWG